MLPFEMVRPTSMFYVNFVAEGLVRLAAFAQLEGIDYWRWRAAEGNSVLVCLCLLCGTSWLLRRSSASCL